MREKAVKSPLCQVYVSWEWVTGLVTVAVIDPLPVAGVSMLLGNDLGPVVRQFKTVCYTCCYSFDNC